MTLNEIIHIALVPPATIDTSLEEKVAAIVNINPLYVRRLFSSKVPVIAAEYDDYQKVEVALSQLEALGIMAFLCSDSELRKPFRLFKAISLEFVKEEILFRQRNGQESKIASQNAFLIIKGRLETNREIEVTNTKKKLNIPMTIITGGIPVRKTVQEKSHHTTSQTEYFLRLYEKHPSDLCIEIKPNGFNFTCLGRDMALTSYANFSILTDKIRVFFAGTIFDDTLQGHFRTITRAASPEANLDIVCKLIYMSHQVFNKRRPLV
jgi:hypothetical protein